MFFNTRRPAIRPGRSGTSRIYLNKLARCSIGIDKLVWIPERHLATFLKFNTIQSILTLCCSLITHTTIVYNHEKMCYSRCIHSYSPATIFIKILRTYQLLKVLVTGRLPLLSLYLLPPPCGQHCQQPPPTPVLAVEYPGFSALTSTLPENTQKTRLFNR